MPTFVVEIQREALQAERPVDPVTNALEHYRALLTGSFDASGTLGANTKTDATRPQPLVALIHTASEAAQQLERLQQLQAGVAKNQTITTPVDARGGPAPAPPQMSALWDADP